jgi:hypothetical protein
MGIDEFTPKELLGLASGARIGYSYNQKYIFSRVNLSANQ